MLRYLTGRPARLSTTGPASVHAGHRPLPEQSFVSTLAPTLHREAVATLIQSLHAIPRLH